MPLNAPMAMSELRGLGRNAESPAQASARLSPTSVLPHSLAPRRLPDYKNQTGTGMYSLDLHSTAGSLRLLFTGLKWQVAARAHPQESAL